MTALPKQFIERMRLQLGDRAEQFFASYQRPPVRAVRVNTLKTTTQFFKSVSPFSLEPVPWEETGFYVEDEKPGKTVLHAAGVYYVQEPSAMCAAPLLGAEGGERVLDLCSAPGGKGTALAARMGGRGVIVLNEINFSRAKILSSNVERLGIGNAIVTCAPPERLADELGAVFDRVLVDAPCSGEGMFKKEPLAIPEWSPENVAMCARRQRDILASAARLVAPGGRLVYSTCTFSAEEDEEQTARFLREHEDFSLVEEHKLWPHEVRGEGHYAALFIRQGGQRSDIRPLTPRADSRAVALYRAFEKQFLSVTFTRLHRVGDRLYSLPEGAFDCGVQTLRAGVCLGDILKDRFEPSHALAMYLKRGEAAFFELDEPSAVKYLSGAALPCEGQSGWVVASYIGFPLGWCKVSGGMAKDHLPKALRI